jgi:hypothetical protein
MVFIPKTLAVFLLLLAFLVGLTTFANMPMTFAEQQLALPTLMNGLIF